MCLEGTGRRQVNRFDHEAAKAHGLEPLAPGEADEPMRGLALGCSGCVEVGYCRRNLDPEQIPAGCTENSARTGTW